MLATVEAYWKQYPDLRLGQIIFNLTHTGPAASIFYIEDDDLLGRLGKELAREPQQ
jgi:hypothetical protein